ERGQRAELFAMRFIIAGRQVRCAHFSVHRGEEYFRPCRARGFYVKNRRGPNLLLQPARPRDTGCRKHDREWLLQRSFSRASNGIRGGSAEIAGGEFGRKRRITIK